MHEQLAAIPAEEDEKLDWLQTLSSALQLAVDRVARVAAKQSQSSQPCHAVFVKTSSRSAKDATLLGSRYLRSVLWRVLVFGVATVLRMQLKTSGSHRFREVYERMLNGSSEMQRVQDRPATLSEADTR